MERRKATFIGFIAIGLWASLAALTEGSGSVPPFQLVAISLAIAGTIGLLHRFRTGAKVNFLTIKTQVWALGVFGLFGYHFLYFTALRNAPAVEASLIGYLWPLLIVLLSTFLPGEKLKLHHCVGAVLGLAGAAAIVSKGGQVAFQAEYGFGYLMAALGALTWSSYSVLSRKFAAVPTEVITGFCIVGAVLALICHLMLEQTVWPQTIIQWISAIGLGLGPVGLAFYVWDYGVKHGDIQTLGAASYLTPLLSTIVLIGLGMAEPTWTIAAAGVLITSGAVFASKDVIFTKSGKTAETT